MSGAPADAVELPVVHSWIEFMAVNMHVKKIRKNVREELSSSILKLSDGAEGGDKPVSCFSALVKAARDYYYADEIARIAQNNMKVDIKHGKW